MTAGVARRYLTRVTALHTGLTVVAVGILFAALGPLGWPSRLLILGGALVSVVALASGAWAARRPAPSDTDASWPWRQRAARRTGWALLPDAATALALPRTALRRLLAGSMVIDALVLTAAVVVAGFRR